jgi:hypothetical protein
VGRDKSKLSKPVTKPRARANKRLKREKRTGDIPDKKSKEEETIAAVRARQLGKSCNASHATGYDKIGA